MTKLPRTLIATSIFALAAGTASAESVTVYTAAPQSFMDVLVPEFEAETGLTVDLIRGGSGELLNRLKAESGSPVADVLWSVDGTVVDFNPDLFTAYSSTQNDAIVPSLRTSELWSPFTAVVMVMAVNKEHLGDAPVPAGWADLAKPEYSKLVTSARADRSGSAFIQLATVLQAFGSEDEGWKTYEGILKNAVLTESSSAVPRFVNDGEVPVGLTLEDAALRYKEGGGPVEIVYPSEGTVVAPDAIALVADSPNPDAGKKFIDFILSAKAQEAVAAQGRRPVRSDVASNPALVPLSEIKTVDYDFNWAAENHDDLLQKWSDMVLDVQ